MSFGTYLTDERYRGGNGTSSHTVCLAHRNRAASAVYFGNIESIEELQRLNIASASEVYVLGDEERCGRDAKNIAIVHLVSALRGKCPDGKVMPVYVQFEVSLHTLTYRK